MAEYQKPLPAADADTKRFWEGTKEHKLLTVRCTKCGRYMWPPREFCNRCRQPDVAWVELSGRAELVSWTVQHHVLHPAFAAEVPYPVVLVALEEDHDCRMIGNLRGATPEQLQIGMLMEPVFEKATDEVTLVHWKPRA